MLKIAGEVKRILDKIYKERANGNQMIENSLKVKLILKGLDPKKFTDDSNDSAEVIEKAKTAAKEFGVNV